MLETKSKKCIFIAYGVDEFGYHLWDYESNKILRSKNVVFNEICTRIFVEKQEKKCK